jgi:hypothetical protein
MRRLWLLLMLGGCWVTWEEIHPKLSDTGEEPDSGDDTDTGGYGDVGAAKTSPSARES